MFKKRYALLIAAALLACALFIPQVTAAAESVLSIFRVADTKTITITVSDLKELMTFAGQLDAQNTGAPSDEGGMLRELLEKADSEVRPLDSAGDFTAFQFGLPAALKDETPRLYAVDAQAQTEVLNTTTLNAKLLKLGATTVVKDSFNGTPVTVSTPPAVLAEYPDVMLAVTQAVAVDAPDAVVNNIWSAYLSIPAIPENLRAQLQAIDPKTRSVYLPVIEGLGRETDIGGTTGYIYASSDLAQVLGMLPGFDDAENLKELKDENTTALIWTKNGVLYVLAGKRSDSALAQIARSVG